GKESLVVGIVQGQGRGCTVHPLSTMLLVRFRCGLHQLPISVPLRWRRCSRNALATLRFRHCCHADGTELDRWRCSINGSNARVCAWPHGQHTRLKGSCGSSCWLTRTFSLRASLRSSARRSESYARQSLMSAMQSRV